MWDPDGPGPQTPKLVIGGNFRIAGNAQVNNVVVYDPNTGNWSPLGSGVNDWVNALAVLPNGDLVAGGKFDVAGGTTAYKVARWNGSTWSSMGSGLTGDVYSLAALPNGDLVAGGNYVISRWDGSTWSQMGSGVSGIVHALKVLPNGDLVAGGDFTTIGGVSARYIARWDGSIWSPFGSGMSNNSSTQVNALVSLTNGDLVAGGEFFSAGGVSASRIARWNGSSWSSIGSGVGRNDLSDQAVIDLAVLSNGDLVAGGGFMTAGGVVAPYIARWATPVPPTITGQPQTQSINVGSALVLTASPAAGSAAVSIQWKRNGINITNGPGGASPGGGTVVGASGSMGNITNGTPATLYISNFQPSDAGSYTATFSNTCGSITSLPATIIITPPPCAADFNADTVLDFFDYLDFVSAFAANQPAADFNADTVIDFFDYLDFVAAFANGC
jgi:hypothetical protein